MNISDYGLEEQKKLKIGTKRILKSQLYSNYINQWFNNNIIKDDTKNILRYELYNDYKKYSENNYILVMKKSNLFEIMKKVMGETKTLNNGNIYYIGYDIKTNENKEQKSQILVDYV